MKNEFDILYIADAQDIWLFNYFILTREKRYHDLLIIYETTPKTTSPHLIAAQLECCGVTLSKDDLNDTEFDTLLNNCRWFITKDFLPFKDPTRHIHKFVVLSWVGESLNRKKTASYQKIPQPGYKRLYVESLVGKVYNHIGFESTSPSPKYYFLNAFDRSGLCEVMSLDPSKKYVTIFSNTYFDSDASNVGAVKDSSLNERIAPIYHNILEYCKKNEINIILKNKMKYGYTFRDTISHDIFQQGEPCLFHPSLCLLAISEFSVGFATSAAVEAAELGCKFISFWKDKKSDVSSNLYNNITEGHGKTYRLAQSKNIYVIDTSDVVEDIVEPMEKFMECARHVTNYNFEIDQFLYNDFGDES